MSDKKQNKNLINFILIMLIAIVVIGTPILAEYTQKAEIRERTYENLQNHMLKENFDSAKKKFDELPADYKSVDMLEDYCKARIYFIKGEYSAAVQYCGYIDIASLDVKPEMKAQIEEFVKSAGGSFNVGKYTTTTTTATTATTTAAATEKKTETPTSTTKKKTTYSYRGSGKNSKSDKYNTDMYSDPEDFYYDNYDDFYEYEDAEDYYNSYQKNKKKNSKTKKSRLDSYYSDYDD